MESSRALTSRYGSSSWLLTRLAGVNSPFFNLSSASSLKPILKIESF